MQSKEKKEKEAHKFWNTQPVPQNESDVQEDGVIEHKEVSDIKQEPYKLPSDFEWYLVDINNEKDRTDVYTLLSQNYVEDSDAVFRFDYSPEFLQWALQPPGWKQDWHLGVRVASNKKIVAFISGIPANLSVHESKLHLVEINFLCVHKKLRSKRLAPVLIKEITRRVNLTGIFQAVYTAGVNLPTPISICRYFHRPLNPKKLCEVGFSQLPHNTTMASHIKKYKLDVSFLNLQPMQEGDVSQVTALLNEFLSQFEFHQVFSEEEVRHMMLPIKDVVFSYVAKDENDNVTDFTAFYSLPSSIARNPKHTHIHAAYLFYYAPKGLGKDQTRSRHLMNDTLILAKQANFDVVNCLGLSHNQQFLDELKFGKGDGYLHYYLYNYRCKTIQPEQMGLVML
ncbi:glycylpeptide N-tetradecanoyltransferase [Boothiomyces macroporosus]|uniref:Glycylpeptide N-tetradecanoyltransferase n=1 Tax=Boothiomyces macroporosus TaxID=261099 RepID=A0AAD5UIZ5_9FUNG|nr:glycylpeptide N-tetradecanoyltransferase [Boothiomyces macroporosus]